jgi:Zn-finger protein
MTFIKVGHTCHYCNSDLYPADKLIEPNEYAERTEKGDWKCGTCIEEEFKDRILRVIPNSAGAKEIMVERFEEDKRESQRRRIKTKFGLR